MTREQIEQYQETDCLRAELYRLKGRKFRLDCGHHVTFGEFLGNDIVVQNGKEMKIVCSHCGS